MQVNSFIFWGFFLIVLIPYFTFLRKSSKAQNWLLLIASYFFFGYSELKMLPVIFLATVAFYFLGIAIEKNNETNPKKSSLLKTLGIVLGVGILVYFKYLNFLIDQFAALFTSLGMQVNRGSFQIVMLLGVSYFTFKLMGYLIQVHRGDIKASRDPIAFGVFVAFFPALMAGPIDRANEFLPQLQNNRTFTYDNMAEGARRVLWGMFMKMCVSDRLCAYIDTVFDNWQMHSGISIVVAAIFYFMQAYTDFAGYSNMAIGVSRMMGLKIRENFNRPYMAQNIAELWRRFHMSLTTWITDYIFMPLNVSFRNLGIWGLYLATFINMIVVGAWHGANWTFVVFGIYQGIIVCALSAIEKPRKKFEKKHGLKGKWYYKWPRILLTWIFFAIGTTIFRANSVSDFFGICGKVIQGSGELFSEDLFNVLTMGVLSFAIVLFKDWKDEEKIDIHFLHSDKRWIRIISFAAIILYIVLFAELNGKSFIYYQF